MSAPGFQLCPWPFLSQSTQQSWCGCHVSPLCHILFHSGHRNTCTLAPAAYTSAEQRPHWAPACQLLFVGCSQVEGGLISQVPAIGQEEMTSSCSRRGLDWILGAKSSQKELSSTGTGCPDKKLSHHPLKSLKAMYLCPWGTWFSEGLGSVRLMAGLMVLEIFFNLSNSMKIFLIWTPQYSRKSWPQISLWNRAQSYLGGHRGRIIISEKIRIKSMSENREIAQPVISISMYPAWSHYFATISFHALLFQIHWTNLTEQLLPIPKTKLTWENIFDFCLALNDS